MSDAHARRWGALSLSTAAAIASSNLDSLSVDSRKKRLDRKPLIT